MVLPDPPPYGTSAIAGEVLQPGALIPIVVAKWNHGGPAITGDTELRHEVENTRYAGEQTLRRRSPFSDFTHNSTHHGKLLLRPPTRVLYPAQRGHDLHAPAGTSPRSARSGRVHGVPTFRTGRAALAR